MSTPSTRTSERTAHGPGARVLLVLVGLLFLVAGATLSGFAIWALLESPGRRVLAAFTLALFGGIAVYGSVLVGRGLKGWSWVGALGRADERFQRGTAEWFPLVGLAVGATVWLATGGQVSGPALLWYFAVSLALFPLGAAIHELGHLLPGLAQGRTLYALRIWPWTFRRSSSGELRGAPGLRITDGLAGFVQWSGSPDSGRVADLVMLAGGPLANIAGAAMLVAWSGERFPAKVVLLIQAAALCNALMGVENLIPLRKGTSILSDGARILRLLLPGHRAFRMRERLAQQAFLRRPREWNISSRALTDEPAPNPDDRAWLLLLALGVALDRGDRPECDRVLALQLEETSMASDLVREFGLQRVLIHALLDRDPGMARRALARARPSPPGYADLALGATLHAEGRSAEAARCFEGWRRAADTHPGWIIGNEWAVDLLGRALGFVETTTRRQGEPG